MKDLISSIQSLGQPGWIDYVQLVVSIAAVFFAISIPCRIAKTQNKIALLEKRTQIYIEFTELLKTTISWPIALANACGTNIKRINTWDTNVKKIFVTAGFLFSKELKEKFDRLFDLYSKIRWYDGYIEEGLAYLSEEDKNEILHLFQKESCEHITDDEFQRLKQLSINNQFVCSEDGKEVMDIYSLSEKQNKYAKEVTELQKIIIEEMEKEIHLSNK